MKRILITGDSSYIGRSFMRHVFNAYNTDEISVRNKGWHKHNFSSYDVVLHVAAVVHQKLSDRGLYYHVNRDITRDVCEKALGQGVKHFVFLSTMAVYGMAPSRKGDGQISLESKCNPCDFYGESKLEAEHALQELKRNYQFSLSIIRPPMIYGRNCPGNYFHRLMYMGRSLPIFPFVRKNRLSMLGIENLCELLRIIIDNESDGIFLPQDQDAFGTQDRLRIIAELFGKKIKFSKLLGRPFKAFPLVMLDSLFGDLYYADEICHFNNSYFIHSFYDTVQQILQQTKPESI